MMDKRDSWRAYCRVVGGIIGVVFLFAYILQQTSSSTSPSSLRLLQLSLGGLILAILDRLVDMKEFVEWRVTGQGVIRGHEEIYDKKVEILAEARTKVYLYLPITCFGIYCIGKKRGYERMVAAISQCVERGVEVKILCDIFDWKTLLGAKGLLKTGASIRCRREHDRFRYYLIADRRIGIEPRTAGEPTKGSNGSLYRPMSDEADLIRRASKIDDLWNEFETAWNDLGEDLRSVLPRVEATTALLEIQRSIGADDKMKVAYLEHFLPKMETFLKSK